jgi:O-antigen/teichoic acid export membrane protein
MLDRTKNLETKALRGASWLGLFRLISQIASWATTIVVARILLPEDYGLMGMATVLTGYVALFHELGLGMAIVQREEINNHELSSLFWLMTFWGLIIALICFVLAYPTAAIFHESRLLRLTQVVAILYIIGSPLIVPLNILKRQLRFKAIGFIEATSAICGCCLMVIMAWLGAGVWTLIGGHIAREFVKVVLVFLASEWRPRLFFNFSQTKPYIRFGVCVAGANSLDYICNRSPLFFGGRALGSQLLGFYAMAIQIAQIPMDKIVSLINYVAFPLLSRYQKHPYESNRSYLQLIKLIATITFPLFLGGIFVAGDLIPVLLGTKWTPTILPFRMLCFYVLITAITTPDGLINEAHGRPHWPLYMNFVSFLILPISFYFTANRGLEALPIPWITVYPLIRLSLTWATLRKLKISIVEYLNNLKHPFWASTSMLCLLFIIKFVLFPSSWLDHNPRVIVILMTTIGAILYFLYLFIFQRGLVNGALRFAMSKSS